jgi:DNA-binding NarL/FixJ family response regulator
MSSTTHASPVTGILVADSNQTQRQLLVAALRRRPEFELAHCPLEGDAILAELASAKFQVLIMNLAHPRDGWQDMTVVRRVHLVRPEVAQLLLLDSYDRDLVVNAFRSGARGLFCFAESAFRLLCKCIQTVRAGQIWANDQQVHYLIEALTNVPSLRMVSAKGLRLLTPREEQVVALVADGLSNREVALELDLSEHTIKKYLFRIFDKLGISSRVELVLYAVSHGGPRQAEWMAGASHKPI